MACEPIKKDPDAFLDYSINWSDWLVGGDVIVSATWTVPTGLVGSGQSFSGTYATIWLSGGTVGQVYQVTCEIVTTANRQDDRSIYIQVEQR
jgi:hypothetical protein